jgi:hypothetical protein
MLKENIVTLTDGGEQKRFKVRQMPASKAEKFLLKVISALGGGLDVNHLNSPEMLFGALVNAPVDKVEGILDELLSNISRVHEGNIETQLTAENVDGFIEELPTLLKLRGEALKINNFFQGAEGKNFGNFSGDAVMIKRQS